MNKVIILDKRPIGKPTLEDFRIDEEAIPTIKDGEVLLKTNYVSVDPYLRARMNDSKSYVPPCELNKAIQSGIIVEVFESKHANFKKGDFVSGNLEWKEWQMSTGKGLQKIDGNDIKLSAYLGILGMTGLTAYFGLMEIGLPKKGETIVVSGAAGAVGTIVGQIGKLLGCKVVGITGSDEKVAVLKTKFQFDHAINYKTVADLRKAIKAACPDGVDIYFDNVGGEISDAVLANINKFARLPVCGAISLYNSTISWLMEQIADGPLIDGSSLYRERVGELVASPLLTLRSRYDAPGCLPVSGDAFVTPAVTLLDAGRLRQLTPSLYGSRKTGVPHVPVCGDGWALAAGTTACAELIAGVPRGALVDRLSMGRPAANGDFSGVIKNSFEIRDGQVGHALSETMISGNVAQMLRDVSAVSRARIDTGGWVSRHGERHDGKQTCVCCIVIENSMQPVGLAKLFFNI